MKLYTLKFAQQYSTESSKLYEVGIQATLNDKQV
jgi:hypothetical protein